MKNPKEKIMNKPNTPNPMLERSPEPFEEVWIFPEGWDLSEMETKPAKAQPVEPEAFPAERLLFVRPRLTV
jgi:hypothetical protein